MNDEFFRDLKPPRAPKEQSLEAKLREWVEMHGWIYLKNQGTQHFPDRTILGPNWVAFLELKRQGQKPRPGQVRAIQSLTKLKHYATWSDSFQACTIFLKAIDLKHNPIHTKS